MHRFPGWRAALACLAAAAGLHAGCNGDVSNQTSGASAATGGLSRGPCADPGPFVGSCDWRQAPASPAPHCREYTGMGKPKCQEDGESLFSPGPCDPAAAVACCTGVDATTGLTQVDYIFSKSDPDLAKCMADPTMKYRPLP